jgi:hypothetical protein
MKIRPSAVCHEAMRAALAAGVCGLLSPGVARADVIYQSDFETGSPGPMWSSLQRIDQAPAFTRFLGRYSEDEGVALNFAPPVSGLQPGQYFRYTATFDLYIIDSWDGDDTVNGPDRFIVSENTHILFNETFANQHPYQSFRPPDVGPAHMGFNPNYKDSIYRGISVTFTGQPTEQIKLKFKGEVMQGMNDESWGIDNVLVTYQIVPAPGSAALLGLGGLLMLRRRR